eukprot:c23295_g1_i1 orf=377-1144(-)
MVGGSSWSRKQDALDRLVIFLAKRDGIDKLVKTFQYVAKLAHWRLEEGGQPGLAERAKKWEVSCGISRKAFRTGRFLSGLNALRGRPASNLGMQLLTILSNGGEMVYFFFDHLLWLARIGLLDPHLASRMSFVSAFGEAFGYIFFIISDLILISHGLHTEKELLLKVAHLSTQEVNGEKERHDLDGLIKEARAKLCAIRMQRVMQIFAIAANLADLVIALADIAPNPFCNHAVTLGISGLVSAWSGWYRNWPSSS